MTMDASVAVVFLTSVIVAVVFLPERVLSTLPVTVAVVFLTSVCLVAPAHYF